MGSQKPSGIPSRSAHCRLQFGFLSLLLVLILFLNACDCRPYTTSRNHKYGVFEIKSSWRQNLQKDKAECSGSAAGRRKPERGAKLGLGHIHGSCSPLRAPSTNRSSVVARILQKDRYRVQAIRSRLARGTSPLDDSGSQNVPISPGQKYDTGDYVVTVGIGTPAKDAYAVIDTGSDITWIDCQPCSTCGSSDGSLFDPSGSSTYKPFACDSTQCQNVGTATGYPKSCSSSNGCQYEVRYGDGSQTTGDFSQDTLTLGSDTFDGFAFGCAHNNPGFQNSVGLVGLGRNQLALPAQTDSKYGSAFAYCLPDFNSPDAVGSMSFGSSAISSSAITTALQTQSSSSTYYYVGLSGISVGGQMLSVSSDAFSSQGTIIDSGTVITRLPGSVYDALKSAFTSLTSKLPKGSADSLLDTCYDLSGRSSVPIPIVTFHFEDSASVDVNTAGTLMIMNNDASQVCLAFASTDDVGIIGNFQQQRYQVSYDTANEKLGFEATSCSSN